MTIFKRIAQAFTKESPSGYKFAGKRILAVEDEVSQRVMIQKTLEKKGFTVWTAEDGLKGLEMAQSQNPDLILLDVILPGLRGDEVCRRLKADGRTKNIPVIFLTSLDAPKDIIKHFDLGADIHLTKPINPKELISQVEISLGQSTSA